MAAASPPLAPPRPVASRFPVTISNEQDTILAPADRFAEAGRRALVLLVVVVPFLALGLAVQQLWDRAVNGRDLALLVGLYVPVSLGVTVGFHRMLTHRGFRAHPVVQFTLLVLGSMALEGAAVGWAANHQKHHARSDKAGDPHSPIEGFWHAHLGWLFRGEQADPAVYCRHLLKDPVVMFVHRTFLLWVILGMLIPFLVGGWSGFLWGGLVRVFFVHHVTWSVNSVCHLFGKRDFPTADRSRNHWAVGLLGMGEGWHNNHHAFPRSAVHGLGRWQVDVSALVITVLEKLRLARDVYRVSPEMIAQKRLAARSA